MTSLFILFADLTPKRLGMVAAETVAVRIVRPMLFMVLLFKPLVWLFNELSGLLLRLVGMPTSPRDEITSDDISAMMDAGAEAGVLHRQEHQVIENVFELESRLVPSSMTPRESIIYFTLDEGRTASSPRWPSSRIPVPGVRQRYRQCGRLRRFQGFAAPGAGRPRDLAEGAGLVEDRALDPDS